MNRRLFIQGDLGDAIGLNFNTYRYVFDTNQNSSILIYRRYNSLMYSVSTGLMFDNGLETSFKFEDYGLQSSYKQFALRLGYRLKLSK
jgi:hypothetical protein